MRRYVFLALLLLVLPVAPAAWAGPEDEIRTLFDRFVAAQNAHDPERGAGSAVGLCALSLGHARDPDLGP